MAPVHRLQCFPNCSRQRRATTTTTTTTNRAIAAAQVLQPLVECLRDKISAWQWLRKQATCRRLLLLLHYRRSHLLLALPRDRLWLPRRAVAESIAPRHLCLADICMLMRKRHRLEPPRRRALQKSPALVCQLFLCLFVPSLSRQIFGFQYI
jgi:hypothetical protein